MNKNKKQDEEELPQIDLSKIFNKSALGKIGFLLIILAIIGLIISYTVPWAYVDYENSPSDLDEKFFGHDLENSDDVHLAFLGSFDLSFIFLGVGSYGFDDYTDFIDGTPAMADIGLFFILILGVVIVVFETSIQNNKKNSKKIIFSRRMFGYAGLFSSFLIFLAGVRFIGLNIGILLKSEVLEESFLKGLFAVFPAAYILLIFGIIFFILSIRILSGKKSSKVKCLMSDCFGSIFSSDKKGSIDTQVQKFALLMLVFSVMALIFMPLFPWVTVSMDDETSYLMEDDIMLNGEMNEDIQDDLGDSRSLFRSYSSLAGYSSSMSGFGFSSGYSSSYYEDLMDSYEDYVDSNVGIYHNISGIGLFFWLSLIFSFVLLVGVELFRFGKKFRLFGHMIFLIGVLIAVFAVLILVNHVWLIGNVGMLSESLEDLMDSEASFGFNFLPLLFGVGLTIVSLMYIKQVFLISLTKVTSSLGISSKNKK